MKIVSFFLLVSVCLFIACTSSETFVKTGPECEPLGDDEPITIFISKKPGGEFRQIGILTFESGSFSERLETTQRIARKYGANGVIIKTGLADEKGIELVRYNAKQNVVPKTRTNAATQDNTLETAAAAGSQKFILIRVDR